MEEKDGRPIRSDKWPPPIHAIGLNIMAQGTNNRDTPKQDGFIGEKTFEGIPWPPFTTQKALDATRNYDIRDDDVWVVTYPKSGTTWMGEIVNLIQANGQVEDVNRDQKPTPIEFGNYAGKEPVYKRAMTWKSPRTFQTHVLEHMIPKQIYEGRGKVIYVIRNPKDVAVSFWHFQRHMQLRPEYVEWDSFIQRYHNGEVSYGSWFSHTLEYWIKHRHDNNFLFVKYEDLKRDLRGSVVQIADFLGRPLSDEAIDLVVEHSSLESMRKMFQSGGSSKPSKEQESTATKSTTQTWRQEKVVANLIRKGIVGDWKTQFTVAQNEIFNKLYEKEMKGSGLTLDFV